MLAKERRGKSTTEGDDSLVWCKKKRVPSVRGPLTRKRKLKEYDPTRDCERPGGESRKEPRGRKENPSSGRGPRALGEGWPNREKKEGGKKNKRAIGGGGGSEGVSGESGFRTDRRGN